MSRIIKYGIWSGNVNFHLERIPIHGRFLNVPLGYVYANKNISEKTVLSVGGVERSAALKKSLKYKISDLQFWSIAAVVVPTQSWVTNSWAQCRKRSPNTRKHLIVTRCVVPIRDFPASQAKNKKLTTTKEDTIPDENHSTIINCTDNTRSSRIPELPENCMDQEHYNEHLRARIEKDFAYLRANNAATLQLSAPISDLRFFLTICLSLSHRFKMETN